MYYCDKCGYTTPSVCREAHRREAEQAAGRMQRMVEIRAALEAMTDAEFREFNERMNDTP